MQTDIHSVMPTQSQWHVNLIHGHRMSPHTKHQFPGSHGQHMCGYSVTLLSISLLQCRCVSVTQSLGAHTAWPSTLCGPTPPQSRCTTLSHSVSTWRCDVGWGSLCVCEGQSQRSYTVWHGVLRSHTGWRCIWEVTLGHGFAVSRWDTACEVPAGWRWT